MTMRDWLFDELLDTRPLPFLPLTLGQAGAAVAPTALAPLNWLERNVLNPIEVPFMEAYRPSSWSFEGQNFNLSDAANFLADARMRAQLGPHMAQSDINAALPPAPVSQRDAFIDRELSGMHEPTFLDELELRRHHTPLVGQLAATAPQFLIPGGQATALQGFLGRTGAQAAGRGGLGAGLVSRGARLGEAALEPFAIYDRGMDALGRGAGRAWEAARPSFEMGIRMPAYALAGAMPPPGGQGFGRRGGDQAREFFVSIADDPKSYDYLVRAASPEEAQQRIRNLQSLSATARITAHEVPLSAERATDPNISQLLTESDTSPRQPQTTYQYEQTPPSERNQWLIDAQRGMRLGREGVTDSDLPTTQRIGEEQAPYGSQPFGFKGIQTTARLPNEPPIEFDVEAIDLADPRLQVSNDPFTFEPNPDYPEFMQPRARESEGMRANTAERRAQFDPHMVLMDDPLGVDRGLPIVGDRGENLIVESGNGRIMDLMTPEVYDRYAQDLPEYAERYGIPQTELAQMQRPVLVRRRTTPMTDFDLARFVQIANNRAVAAMNPVERARALSGNITPELLNQVVVREGTDLGNALHRPENDFFINRVLSAIPSNDRTAFFDDSGNLNLEGQQEITNALFYRAFGEDGGAALNRFYVQANDERRNIGNAIRDSSGKLVRLRARIDEGSLPAELDIAPLIVRALDEVSHMDAMNVRQRTRMSLEEMVDQASLQPRSRDEQMVLQMMGRTSRRNDAGRIINAPKPFRDVLDDYLDRVLAIDDVRTPTLGGEMALPNRTQFLSQSLAETSGEAQAARDQAALEALTQPEPPVPAAPTGQGTLGEGFETNQNLTMPMGEPAGARTELADSEYLRQQAAARAERERLVEQGQQGFGMDTPEPDPNPADPTPFDTSAIRPPPPDAPPPTPTAAPEGPERGRSWRRIVEGSGFQQLDNAQPVRDSDGLDTLLQAQDDEMRSIASQAEAVERDFAGLYEDLGVRPGGFDDADMDAMMEVIEGRADLSTLPANMQPFMRAAIQYRDEMQTDTIEFYEWVLESGADDLLPENRKAEQMLQRIYRVMGRGGYVPHYWLFPEGETGQVTNWFDWSRMEYPSNTFQRFNLTWQEGRELGAASAINDPVSLLTASMLQRKFYESNIVIMQKLRQGGLLKAMDESAPSGWQRVELGNPYRNFQAPKWVADMLYERVGNRPDMLGTARARMQQAEGETRGRRIGYRSNFGDPFFDTGEQPSFPFGGGSRPMGQPMSDDELEQVLTAWRDVGGPTVPDETAPVWGVIGRQPNVSTLGDWQPEMPGQRGAPEWGNINQVNAETWAMEDALLEQRRTMDDPTDRQNIERQIADLEEYRGVGERLMRFLGRRGRDGNMPPPTNQDPLGSFTGDDDPRHYLVRLIDLTEQGIGQDAAHTLMQRQEGAVNTLTMMIERARTHFQPYYDNMAIQPGTFSNDEMDLLMDFMTNRGATITDIPDRYKAFALEAKRYTQFFRSDKAKFYKWVQRSGADELLPRQQKAGDVLRQMNAPLFSHRQLRLDGKSEPYLVNDPLLAALNEGVLEMRYQANLVLLHRLNDAGLVKRPADFRLQQETGNTIPVANELDRREWRYVRAGRPFNRYLLPNWVANVLESQSGVRPTMIGRLPMADQLRRIPGLGNRVPENGVVDYFKALAAMTNGLKIAKFTLSPFQMQDLAMRALINHAGFNNVITGFPILKAPKVVTDALNLYFHTTDHRAAVVRAKSLDPTPIFPGRNISHLGYYENGLSRLDQSVFFDRVRSDLTELVRKETRNANSPSAVRYARAAETWLRNGMFEAFYQGLMLDQMDNVAVPLLMRLHPDWTDRQIMGEAARTINNRMSAIGVWQRFDSNPHVNAWGRIALISVNEQQSWIAQLFEALPLPRNTSWQFFLDGWASTFFWGGIFAAVLSAAAAQRDGFNAGEYRDDLLRIVGVGQEDAFGPFAMSEYSPFGIDYNPEFLRPEVPFGEGRGGRRLNVDWMGQADTPFRILNPYQYVTSRASVPVRAVDNLATGETFFGEPLDTTYKRFVVQPLLDIAPIPVEAGLQASRDWGPMANIVPEGEGRLGAQGMMMQALGGFNLTAESNAALSRRAAANLGYDTDMSKLEPHQRREVVVERERMTGGEIARSAEIAAERGQDWGRVQVRQNAARTAFANKMQGLEIEAERLASGLRGRGSSQGMRDEARRIVRQYFDAKREQSSALREVYAFYGTNFDDGEVQTEGQQALDAYYALTEQATDEYGNFDSAMYTEIRDQFMARLTPTQRNYVLRNTNMNDIPPTLLQLLMAASPGEAERIRASQAARGN